MGEFEIDCPVCDDGKKHLARIIRKSESQDRMIVEVECLDCKSKGTIKVFKIIGIEIYDF
jgi:hypothetical protein